jgi:hypothetical protein
MTTSITTRHIHVLLHLNTLIGHLKAMEQSTFTAREREVVQESLQWAYEWAESMLPPDLLQVCRSGEEQGGEGDMDAT